MSTNAQRRAAARRKLERQLARKAEEQRQRRQQAIIASVVAGVVVVGLVVWLLVANSGDDDTTATGPDGCGYTASPDGSATFGLPPENDLKKDGTVTLNLALEQGPVTITMDRAKAPCAVNSFEFLASNGYFDGTPCHRLTTGAFGVLQCGDPTGTGSGGPGYRFNEEPPTDPNPYPEGAVAMANSSQPGSTGSQFFICYTDCSVLPPSYSLVGEVTSGLDIVKQIAAAGTDNGTQDGRPAQPVTITSATVSE